MININNLSWKKNLFWPILLSFGLIYLTIALYHIFFAPINFDEINYLIKGRAFVVGQHKPFEEYGYQTGYPPLSYLLVGITQIFGPNILLPRFVSFFFLILIFLLTVFAGFKIGGKKLAVISAVFLALSFNFSKTLIQLPPYPMATFLIILAVTLIIVKPKNIIAQGISILLVVVASYIRLQALLIFIILTIFLITTSKTFYYKTLITLWAIFSLVILALPFYPQIMIIFVQLPPIDLLSPKVSGIHSLQLSIFYKDITFAKRLFSVYRFFVYYSSLVFLGLFLIAAALIFKKLQYLKDVLRLKSMNVEGLLIYIVLINAVVVIMFSFFSLCPNCAIVYMNLVLPLVILTLGWGLVYFYDNLLINKDAKKVVLIIVSFVFLWTFLPTPYHHIAFPQFPTPITRITQVSKEFSKIIPANEQVFAIGGQSYLFMANLQTYPPLVNGLYTFRDSKKTGELLKFGYWNKEAATIWAKDAKWALIDEQTIYELTINGDNTRDLVREIEDILKQNFQPVTRLSGPNREKISVYKKISF